MADDESKAKIDARVLDRILRDSARVWWNVTILCKSAIFLVGILGAFIPFLSTASILVILVLSVAAELSGWKSNSVREMWDVVHRELDARDSFGWPISKSEISDIMVQLSKGLRQRVYTEEAASRYFTSVEPPAPTRAIENVQESAWWSKHLARITGYIFAGITIVIILLSIIAVLFIIETINNYNLASTIARSIVSVVMIVFSLDLIRLSKDFFNFSRKASDIERQAERLLESNKQDTVEAIKLMHEYQLARATSPMIPQTIFDVLSKDLHEMWRVHRGRRLISQ